MRREGLIAATLLHLPEGCLLDRVLADVIPHGHTLGFVYPEFIPARNPLQALVQQACPDEAHWLVQPRSTPTLRATVNRMNKIGVTLFNRRILVGDLAKYARHSWQSDAQL